MSFIHFLVALLIAAFAIGAPLPAQADCAQCDDCSTKAPAKNKAPCSEKGLTCQIATSCVSQLQKVPAQIPVQPADDGRLVAFGYASSVAMKSAFITPETAPPRL